MPNDPTIATYDKYAQVYDEEVIEFWEHFPAAFIDEFIAKLPEPGKRILNLGSGSGRDALLLRDHGLGVVCVDASEAMIAITKRLGFESYRQTFADLRFPAQSFDGVWAYTSLIHVPKTEVVQAVKTIHALLKPGGAFAVGAIEGETAGMIERKTMPQAARYFKYYAREELKQLVEGQGFAFAHEHDYQPHTKVYLNQLYTKTSR